MKHPSKIYIEACNAVTNYSVLQMKLQLLFFKIQLRIYQFDYVSIGLVVVSD
jgi:hypothetical protein